MPDHHKYRPHHLALAIALAMGCADLSLAQEKTTVATSPALNAEQQIAQLDTFIKADTTVQTKITHADDGINRTFGEANDLVIVSGNGALTGVLDGGGGSNVLQLNTTGGGTLGESRGFLGMEVKRNTWTVAGPSDFGIGAMIRSKATLVNEGRWSGDALVQGVLNNNGQMKGNVTVLSGGSLINLGAIGGDVVINRKGTVAGRGVVRDLWVDGKMVVDTQHGAPTIKGDLTLSKTAELTYEVNANRISETIKVEGLATIAGVTLKIVATPGDYPESSHNLLLHAGRIEGEFNIVDERAFLKTVAEYGERSVELTHTRNAVKFEKVAATGNGKSLGKSIDDTPDVTPAVPSNTVEPTPAAPALAPTTVAATASTPALTPTPTPTVTRAVVAAKVSIPANAAVAALLQADRPTATHAVEQLAGGDHANLAKATLNSDTPISATLLSAMRQLDDSSAYSHRSNQPRVASGNAQTGRVWLQALGHGGTLDRNFDPMHHTTKGLVLGADWRIDEQWRLGVMGGKSDTRLDSRQLDGDLDSWHLGVYGVRQSGRQALRLGATYSHHDASTQRRVSFKGFSDRPQGRHQANTQQAFAELGYDLGGMNLSIEPFAGVGYQRYQRNSYTEKGGAAAMKVHGQTRDAISSTLGLRLAKINRLANGMQLTPRFSAGWKYTYGQINNQTRQRLVTGGRDFTVEGAALDRDNLLVNAGLDLGLSTRHTLGIALNAEIGNDNRNHGVMGQWRLSF